MIDASYQSRKAKYSIDPGRLDHRILLLLPFDARDSSGGFSTIWTSVATVWASQRLESARRLYAADELRNESRLVYRIRHRSAIDTRWRIQHGSNVYEITSIDPLGRNHLLDLTVRGVDMDTANIVSVLLMESGDVFTLENGQVFALEGAH